MIDAVIHILDVDNKFTDIGKYCLYVLLRYIQGGLESYIKLLRICFYHSLYEVKMQKWLSAAKGHSAFCSKEVQGIFAKNPDNLGDR